jgi:hypothetical protein
MREVTSGVENRLRLGSHAISRGDRGCSNKILHGLPVHRGDLLRQLRINSTGFVFQGEILTKLLRSGCSMTEVGVAGAEMTRNSSALRFKGLVNIAKVLVLLVWEVRRFDGRRQINLSGYVACNDVMDGHAVAADV